MAGTRILTCLSITVVALLVAAWIANFFGQFGIGTRSGKSDYHYVFRSGMFSASQHGNFMVQGLFWRAYPKWDPDMPAGGLSSLSARLTMRTDPDRWSLEVPIVLLITAIIPLLVGSLTRFRFRLWQYFAFTALVALELAYFLR